MKENIPEKEPVIDEESYLEAKQTEAEKQEAIARQEAEARAKIISYGLADIRDAGTEVAPENITHIDVQSEGDEVSVDVRAGEWVNADRPTLPGRNEFIDD